ncbi:histidine decarboxylase [Triplophysa dalaica]|uniref:histidine decarboxylase n=1 Tax=Triplophysa dalaica TaxID=1582913 RepID=UPI0024DFD088|nr:histidine decarboxylase [Triplophysa dalaica]
MEADDYTKRGKEMVDFIRQYLTGIRDRRVVPDVQPGFMRPLLPTCAPHEPEDWNSILQDVENIILPGVVHWQSPHMHAYFPALNSWPSLLGDMLADAINCLGFTWASSPACTELEMCVLDWLCKALGLPDHYLHHHPQSTGGGILQLCATLGSTGVCSFDRLDELGPVCAREALWLHVDAAYAGSALLCPELRYFINGIQFADSFVFNPSKWMMVHFDCTAFWVKNKLKLQQTFTVDPLYLRHDNTDTTDFMHWQISLSRRFRSLKLWFVMRSFGLKNLQAHIRHGVEMAKLFESLVRSDTSFQIPAQRHLGLVVFCLRAGNGPTQELLRELTKSGQIFLIPAAIGNKLIIRFTVTSQFTSAQDIERDWRLIQQTAREVLQTRGLTREPSLVSDGDSCEENAEEEQEEVLMSIHSELSRMRLEPMIDERLVRQGQRRAIRSLSCSAELPPARPDRGHPFNEALASGSLPQIPERPTRFEQRVHKRLLKVHSVPSLSQVWAQCGMQQLYHPFKRGWVTSRASCFNCFPLTDTRPLPTK